MSLCLLTSGSNFRTYTKFKHLFHVIAGIGHKMTKTLPTPAPTKVQSCYCCPFGFHIDLDFVKYCEELSSSGIQSNGTRSVRRDRRRQRQSMEVMLGLDDSMPWMINNGHSLVNEVRLNNFLTKHKCDEVSDFTLICEILLLEKIINVCN